MTYNADTEEWNICRTSTLFYQLIKLRSVDFKFKLDEEFDEVCTQLFATLSYRVKDKSFSKDGMNRSKMKVFAKNVNFAIFRCVDKVKTSCLKLMSKFSIFTLVSDNA